MNPACGSADLLAAHTPQCSSSEAPGPTPPDRRKSPDPRQLLLKITATRAWPSGNIVLFCTNYADPEGGEMREPEPTTQTMKASQARQEWSQILNRVFRKQTRVLVEKSGIPVAAIVSADDLERLDRLDAERRARF